MFDHGIVDACTPLGLLSTSHAPRPPNVGLDAAYSIDYGAGDRKGALFCFHVGCVIDPKVLALCVGAGRGW